MPDLRLPRLPERIPVKLVIQLTPDLNLALNSYAALYARTYGREEAVVDLVPAMLATFLDGDRVFARARQDERLRG